MVNTGLFMMFLPGFLNPTQQQAVVNLIQCPVGAGQYRQLVADTLAGFVDVGDVGKGVKLE